jgi:glycosyltransferase involved in cell wall biosynthesis
VDVIFSSSFPVTAHLIARTLHRATGVPWLAEFRDPWSEARPPGTEPGRAARLERKLAREATTVTMTSRSWAERHAELWNRPVHVLPNGHAFDATATAALPDELVVGYLGTFYPETQDLSGAWSAIRHAVDDGLDIRRIRFIGTLHAALRDQLSAQGLAAIVEETGFVSYGAAMAHLRACSVLLLAGPRDGRASLRGQVPAKLAEYLVSGLPIIYVGDLDGDVASILREHPGCHLHAPSDVDGIMRALKAPGRVFERDTRRLSRRAIAGQLATLLDGVRRRNAMAP